MINKLSLKVIPKEEIFKISYSKMVSLENVFQSDSIAVKKKKKKVSGRHVKEFWYFFLKCQLSYFIIWID